MSAVTYISFPKEPKVLCHPDATWEDGKLKGVGIGISDKEDATFTNCFINPCIYNLHTILPPEYYTDTGHIIDDNLDNQAIRKKLKTRADRWQSCYQQGLYDFIHINLEIGEFVEIYSGWTDHVNYDFGPPKSEIAINLDNLLDTPLPTNQQHMESSKLTILKVADEYGTYKLQGSTAKDYDNSEMYYKRRLANLQAQGDEQGAATACIELGHITKYYQDADAAQAWYKQAWDIWVKLGDDINAAHACCLLARLPIVQGMVQRRSNELDENVLDAFAVGWFNQMLEHALKAGDYYCIADAYAGLANRAVLRNDFLSAEHFYLQILDHKLKLDDITAGGGGIYTSLAHVASERGDYDAAINYYKQVLNIYMKMGDRYCHNLEFVYRLLHELAIKFQKTDDAAIWHKNRLAIRKRYEEES